MIKKIDAKAFENEAMKAKAAVIDFSAVWCGPCKMVAPVMAELSEEMKDQAEFYNIDIDENPQVAQQFGVLSIPTILVLKDGVEAGRTVGFQPKDGLKPELEGFLK